MFKAFKEGGLQFDRDWWMALLLGMFVSFVVAALVIKVFLAFLKKYPLAWFGYYRIVLAAGLYFLLK
jgi:undecaprenyl-diphosphatase